jgi:DNA-binding CsgD family transcriptional regulator
MLTYDGSVWKTYPLPNKTTFRSLAVGKDGNIYVGGQNDFGKFIPNEKGLWVFHSFKELIPEKHREFEDVWDIVHIEGSTYFRASNKIYELNDGKIFVEDSFQADFMCTVRKHIIIYDSNKGLFKLQNGTYQKIVGSETLINKTIANIIESANGLLIATKEHGVFELKNDRIEKWENEAQQFIIDNEIRSMIRLSNDKVSIGTIYGGLIILNKEGKADSHINNKHGLLSNSILSQFLDKDNNLWLGLDKGINYIQINSSFTRIFPDGQLEGAGYTAQIHQDKLYLGTNNGLYSIPWNQYDNPLQPKSFSLVNNSKGQTWGLDVIGDKLILSHDEGVFTITGNNAQKFMDDDGYWLFHELEGNNKFVVTGTYHGLSLLKQDGQEWIFIQKISDLVESSRFLEADKYGNLWVAHPYKGIYKINKSEEYSTSNVELLGKAEGLFSNLHNHLFKIKDEIIFCAEQGFFTYNYDSKRFDPYTPFYDIFDDWTKIRRLAETPNGNIWFISGTEIGLLEVKDVGLRRIINKKVFPELKDLLNGGFELIYPYDENNVFISTERGFIHYSPNNNNVTTSDSSFQVVLNEVAVTHPEHNIIFHGQIDNKYQSPSNITYPHNSNAFSFSFSSTSYAQNHLLQYRYKLDGYSDEWSNWSAQNKKEYTNLPSGDYSFLIQAKDYQYRESKPYSYSFSIAPPWYLSIWAYILYAVLIAFLLFYLYRWNSKNYQNLEEGHEKTIKQNQQEIDQLKSEKMELELEHKKRALVSSTLLLVQKNETLAEIKAELNKIKKETKDRSNQPKIDKLIHKLQQDEVLDEGWEQFMLHFNELHGDFLKRIKQTYPTLTPKDLKLCGYLRMNLSTKEIASLMNVSIRGVEASRYRIRKKCELESTHNLTEFLMEF